jgi:predicted transcriptional regulator
MIKSYLHFLLSNQLISASVEPNNIRYELAEAGYRAIMQYEASNPELVIRQQTVSSVRNHH